MKHNAPKGSRAISLTRISSDSQSDGTSPDTQHEANVRLIEREGWTLYKRYDEVESGRLYLSREITQKAIEDLEADRADVLVLYDSTRYGRDVEYQFTILRRILRAGKWLQFAGYQLEYDDNHELTPECEFVFTMFGGMSSSERNNIVRRFRNGKMSLLEAGVTPFTSMSPYGYYLVQVNDVIRGEYPAEQKGRFQVVEKEAETVRLIFQWYGYEGLSYRNICTRLRNMGVLTKTGQTIWSPMTISFMIRNPVYIGEPEVLRRRFRSDEGRRATGQSRRYFTLRPKEERKQLKAPAIVERELWDLCQARAATNKTRLACRNDRKWMLVGLLRCPSCGQSLGCELNDTTVRARCMRHSNNTDGRERCAQASYNVRLLEQWTVRVLQHIFEQPEVTQELLTAYQSKSAPDNSKKLVALDAQIKKIEHRAQIAAQKVIEAIADNLDDTPFKTMLARYSGERRELLAKREAMTQDAPPQSEKPKRSEVKEYYKRGIVEVLQSPDTLPYEKNQLLHALIISITPQAQLRTAPRRMFETKSAVFRLRSPVASLHFLCTIDEKRVDLKIVDSAS